MNKREKPDKLGFNNDKHPIKRTDKLNITKKEKLKREAELIIANEEKEKRAEELILANKEISFARDNEKLAKEKSEENEEKFRNLFEQSPVGLSIRQSNKKVAITVQTAYATSSEKEKAEKAACSDFISKPINRTLSHELTKKHCNK